ncbi:hypothetical protein [Burkholderia phage FLC9]|nr:hypothetical protein [Burkholderia phage FLC9]
MTMQSSGPISMLQAMGECNIGQQRWDAGDGTLSQLAGVGSGQTYAWSYWYGKSNLPTYNNALFAQYAMYIDRNGYISINFRTGDSNAYGFNGDHGPHLEWYHPQMAPIDRIAQYRNVSCTPQKYSGRSNVTLQQAPNASNDFTCIIYNDDNPWGGASDVGVNVLITAIP